MPLTNKYLKYSPEITLEIFTLVWNKLIDYGWKPYSNQKFENIWTYLTKESWLGIRSKNGNKFLQYKNDPLTNLTETTVQEILGYDPFVKDDFVLPKKWCIKSQSRDQDRLINEFARSCGGKHWSDEKNHARSNYLNIIDGRYRRGSIALDKDFTEITFEQFKKYVLKESIEEPKEIIPEYVEYIKSDDVGKIVKVLKWSTASYCEVEFPNGTIKEPFKHLVKPSTKEAFDAQNKPIEKWSIGSYFVIEKDRLYGISFSKRGDICIIKKDKTFNFINKKDQTNWCFDFREGSKWFATKSEAEEFAKTLVEPVKEEVKQPLKQAVHCKTQEEWNFILSKFNPKNIDKLFKVAGCNCIVISDSDSYNIGCISDDIHLKNNYQILSFQEWCDLNGYKIENGVKFEVGDYVILRGGGTGNGVWENELVTQLLDLNNKNTGGGNINPDFNFKYKNFIFGTKSKYIIRHATPEEINNHLISIGQIPAGEPLNTGIEPNKDGAFKYTTYSRTTHVVKTSTISGPLKMTLSIDDEELPMVNIIKTNTIKQLLNND